MDKKHKRGLVKMELLGHLIYEYRKKLRGLALFTFNASEKEAVEQRLRKSGASYHLQEVSQMKMNVFFGDAPCVEIVRSFGEKQLNEYSPEEDFMLGIMLGYDRTQQCQRYLDYCAKHSPVRQLEHHRTNVYSYV